jgi:hypothetical protein
MFLKKPSFLKNFLRSESSQVPERPKVICRDCVHMGRGNLGFNCGASVKREAYITVDYVTGEVTAYPAEFMWCRNVNATGDCRKFEPKDGQFDE